MTNDFVYTGANNLQLTKNSGLVELPARVGGRRRHGALSRGRREVLAGTPVGADNDAPAILGFARAHGNRRPRARAPAARARIYRAAAITWERPSDRRRFLLAGRHGAPAATEGREGRTDVPAVRGLLGVHQRARHHQVCVSSRYQVLLTQSGPRCDNARVD